LFTTSTAGERPAGLLTELVEDEAGVRVEALPGVDHDRDDVGVGHAGKRRAHDRGLEPALRLEDAGRVHEHDLDRAAQRDPDDAAPGGLHLGRDDRDLRADQRLTSVDLPTLGAPMIAT
jgi:hypothetical protein